MKKMVSLCMSLVLVCSTSTFYASAETGAAISAVDGTVFDYELTEDMLSDRVPIYSEDASVLAVNGWTMGYRDDFSFEDKPLTNESKLDHKEVYANVGEVTTQIGDAYCDYKDNLVTDTVRGGFQDSTGVDHYCHTSTGGVNSELSAVLKGGIIAYTNAIEYHSKNSITVKCFAYVGYSS